MSRRKKRPIYFICSTIVNNDLISEAVIAETSTEATDLFFNKFQAKPRIIHGPFYKKKMEQVIVSTPFKITNQVKKAHYNGWLVNAFILKEPENSALLIFLQRLDDKKIPSPKGTIIVPISDLKFQMEGIK
jgi:hypothetical protein